jgi:hypothetical protein
MPTIPLRFHFIWMGKNFPFAYRLSVESCRRHHPDAEIKVHFADPPDNAHWRAVEQYAEMVPLNEDSLLAALPSTLSSVADVYRGIAGGYPAGRSNVLRYLILLRDGGIYLDCDTLTLRPFTPLLNNQGFIGEETVFRADDDRVSGRAGLELLPYGALFGMSYGMAYANARWLGDQKWVNQCDRFLRRGWSLRKLNNAVLGAQAGHPFFTAAVQRIPQIDPGVRFALGPILMNETWDATHGKGMQRLGENAFYFIPPSQTFRFFLGPAATLPSDAYAVHWCNSNHKELVRTLTPEMILSAKGELPLFYQLASALLNR